MNDARTEFVRYVVVCNYRSGRNNARAGAKATVCWTTGGADRVQVTVISRGGRRVTQWERLDRLHKFRVQTVVDDHHPQGAALFDTRERAELEMARWLGMQAEQERPRNQHDPGDEDRRPR